MQTGEYKLLKRETIEKAVNGDEDAIAAVLKRYHNYIKSYCCKYEGYSNGRYVFDEDKMQYLTTKVVLSLSKFRL